MGYSASMSHVGSGKSSEIIGEFAGAELADARLSQRLQGIVGRLAACPNESFPRAVGDGAELEALYRFMSNDRVEPGAILAPHAEQTAKRAAAHDTIWVAHDTTFCRFDGEGRVGLGPLTKKSGGRGFLAHVALAIAPGTTAIPLGVLGLETLVRPDVAKGKRSVAQTRKDPSNESKRWERMATHAGERLRSTPRVVHIMDREADDYSLFSSIHGRGEGFVIRLSDDRCTTERDDETGRCVKLNDVLRQMQGVATRRVALSRRRAGRGGKVNASRDARDAELHFAATTVTLRRPESAPRTKEPAFTANLIRVWEPNPPEGEPAVEWKLLTTEPASDIEQILTVVDTYRARWLIEELFKALKSGCAFEKRQLESYDALVRALAVYLPMAWQLLSLRALSRTQPDEDATTVLSQTQIDVLRHFSRRPLPPQPSVQDALFAIAALGGHLKRNGPPGWLTLGKGLQQLLDYEAGWKAAQEKM